jgi:hypothetical protein
MANKDKIQIEAKKKKKIPVIELAILGKKRAEWKNFAYFCEKLRRDQ